MSIVSNSTFFSSSRPKAVSPLFSADKRGLVRVGGLVFGGSDSLRFASTYRRNIIFVSTEPYEAKQGGLGEVTGTIPVTINKFGTPPGGQPRDMRVIVPYVSKVQAQSEADAAAGKAHFEPTDHIVKTDIKGTQYSFRVMQKFQPPQPGEKAGGYWIYALANSDLFGKTDVIHTYDPYAKDAVELTMPFNQAAGQLIGCLNEPGKGNADGVPLQKFDGQVNTVVANDWLSGPVLYQDGVNRASNIEKMYFLHNTYDNPVPASQSYFDRGVPLPTSLDSPYDVYSPASLAIKAANKVFADPYYIKTILDTEFSKGQPLVEALREHQKADSIFDMHHGLAEIVNPETHPAFQESGTHNLVKNTQGVASSEATYQFVPLKPKATDKDWNQFKQANKKALQIKHGLTVDPNAVVISWANRLEPNQKGYDMVKNATEALLKDKKLNLQMVIAGSVGDGPEEKKIAAWIEKINHDPAYKGKIYFPNKFAQSNEVIQINAGSDFTMLPSVYEPYGISQLEAVRMGSIPLVHGVDGIRSTIYDPTPGGEANPSYNPKLEKYGQTGVAMKPFDPVLYRAALSRRSTIAALKAQFKEGQEEYIPEGKPLETFKNVRKMLKSQSKPGLNRFSPQQKKDMRALAECLGSDYPVLKKADLPILEAILQKDQEEITQVADQNFKDTMIRAVDIARNPAKMAEIRKNGREYLQAMHNPSAIVKRYTDAFDNNDRVRQAKPLEFFSPDHIPFAKPAPPRPIQKATETEQTDPSLMFRRPLIKPQKSADQGFWSSLGSKIYNLISAFFYYLNPGNWFSRSERNA
jgi:glycogen synthase